MKNTLPGTLNREDFHRTTEAGAECALKTDQRPLGLANMGFTGRCWAYREISRDRHHMYVMYVQPAGTGKAGKRSDWRGETGRQGGRIRSDRREGGPAANPGPAEGGKRVVPARGGRWGCQERAGSRQEEPERPGPGRAGRRAAGGAEGGGAPLGEGPGGREGRGLAQSGPAAPGPVRRPLSPGHAAGRAPVHLPGGVQVHLHRGGGAAWPRAAGGRGARGHRDGHGGGRGRGRGGGGHRRGGRGRRGGLGQLGGRWLLRRRLRWRRLLLRRLGDPRASLAATTPRASGTTARPSTFRHGPAGGEGRGGHRNRSDAERTPRLLPGGGGGGGSTGLLSPPAERASEREAARRRGASRRAALALARRCLLRLAPPRH